MANVKAVDNHNRSVLHLAVEGDFSSILSVLLEHGANPDHVDEEGNNGMYMYMYMYKWGLIDDALSPSISPSFPPLSLSLSALHIAMQLGHENCVKVLLTDSDINLTAANTRSVLPYIVFILFSFPPSLSLSFSPSEVVIVFTCFQLVQSTTPPLYFTFSSQQLLNSQSMLPMKMATLLCC